MIDIRDIQGNVVLSTEINHNSVRRYELMKSDYIRLKFVLSNPIHFNLGYYVDDSSIGLFDIVDIQKPSYNTSTGGYEYDLQLDAHYYKWKNKIFKYTPETGGQEASWTLTASLDTHLGIFLRNLKALGYTYRGLDYEFSIDSTVENSAKVLTYDNSNMIDALTAMAEAWECEWWVTDNIIHFGRCEYGTAVDFELGKNVDIMSRSESSSQFATRLYVFGSTRNIPTDYRPIDDSLIVNGVVQKRLMLPSGIPYIDAYSGMSEEEAVEQVVVFDDVYPKTNGNISSVETYEDTVENEDGSTTTQIFYRFKDNGITFSKDYILEGEELRIVFQSGRLNGMDFAVSFNPKGVSEKNDDGTWNSEAQLFEIVANEDYGRLLPDRVLNPSEGDTYILYGWDSTKITDLGLVDKAEEELLARGQEYIKKTQIDPSTYTCKMMSDYMYGLDDNGNQDADFAKSFEIGDKVNLINPAYFKDGRESRIIGYEYQLDKPYDSPSYIIGETAAYSRLGELESKIENITLAGQTYTGNSGSGVYIIGTNDSTKPTNRNVYSALRSDKSFLRKDKDDRSAGKISSDVGFEVGKYVSGASGAILYKDSATGQTVGELDKLYVRMKAYFETLEIINVNTVGGKQILSPAGSVKCIGVEELDDSYRCYFLGEQDGELIQNRFAVNDQIYSQLFNAKEGVTNNISNHYYWRLCVGVSEDTVTFENQQCHYIDLSKTDCDTDSDIPQVGDILNHRGNRTVLDRMNFIEWSSVDAYSPSIILFHGVNSYSLDGKEYVSFGVDKTTNKAYMNVYGDMYVGDRDETSYMRYTPETGLQIKGTLDISTKLGDTTLKDLISASTPEGYQEFVEKVTQDIDNLQQQIDGAIESYFYQYDPTTDNYPAMDWDTTDEKGAHLNDTFTNISSGNAWRWVVDESGNYYWKEIEDTATVKALVTAGKAQDTADGKRRVFVSTPTPPYDLGDLWAGGEDSYLMKCIVAKTENQSYEASDWDYADNSAKIKAEMEALVSTTKTELDGSIADAKMAMATYTDEAKAEVQASIDAVEKAKANVDDVYTKSVADGLISQAEQDAINQANSVAQAERELLEVRVNAYADGVADEAEKAAIADAEAKVEAAKSELHASISETKTALEKSIADTETAAKTYTDEAKAALQTSIDTLESAKANVDDVYTKAMTDGKITTAEENAIAKAQEYATAAQELAETNVKAWADGEIDAAEQAAIDEAQKRVDAAKSELEESIAALDTKLTDLINTTKNDLNNAIGQAKDAANSYTDEAKAALQASIDEMEEAKANLADVYTKTQADEQINKAEEDAIAAAKAQADAAIALSEETIKAYADGVVDAEEAARIKQAEENLATAKAYAEEKANEALNTALDKINTYDYLKAALKEDTTIEGGLIQTSLIKIGYTDDSGVLKTMSGTNGLYNVNSIGGGIASWWGGEMADMADYYDWNGTEWVVKSGVAVPSNIPTGLIRFDGTGYFAGGKFWWDKNGEIHADPTALLLSFDETIGDETLSSTIVNIRKDTALFASMWEKKTDSSGNEYLYTKLPIVTQYGVTMYADATTLDISGIYDALPIDGSTIYWYGTDSPVLKSKITSDMVDSSYFSVVDGILTFVGETGGTSYSSLGSLLNVDTSIDDTATVDRVLYQAAGSGTWTFKPLSEIGGSGTVSGDYLPLTGGTLTLDDLGGFNVYRNNAIYSAVHFYATINGSKTDVGYLGFKGLTPVYIETTGVTHELLHSSNYSSYALPISGGTLTGTLATPDFLFKSDQYGAIIKGLSNTGIRMYYNKADSTYDILEFNSSSGLTFNGNAVWHSGNDGSDSGLDADLLDGCHAYYFYNIFTESISSDALSTFTKRNIGNIKVANSGYSAMLLNFPMFGVGSVSSLELYIPHYDFDTYGLLARISVDSNRYTSWRTFAFTDSNVASATKLQTARTIWGQSFDGTGNVDGTLTLTATSSTLSMYGINVRTNTTGVFGYLNTISSLESNMDTTTRHHNNLLLGKNTTTLNSGYIGFYYQGGADSTSNCMSIGLNGVDNILNVLGTGNVGIGTTTPTYTLHVNGETLVTGHVTTYGSIYMNNSTIFNAKNSSGVQESWLWPRWSDNNTYLNFGSGGYFYIRNRDSGRCLTLDKSGNGLFYGGVTMYSDIRKKTKLQDVELSLKQIANAPLIEHYYNSDEKKTTHVGSIAQYWAGLNDWFCRKDSEGYYTMEIQNAALASAISVARELVKYESKTDKKIRMLKKRISQLEDEIESLKKGA